MQKVKFNEFLDVKDNVKWNIAVLDFSKLSSQIRYNFNFKFEFNVYVIR